MINHLENLINQIESVGDRAVTTLEITSGFLDLAAERDEAERIEQHYFAGYAQIPAKSHPEYFAVMKKTLDSISKKIDLFQLTEEDVNALINIYYAAHAMFSITAGELDAPNAHANAVVLADLIGGPLGLDEQFGNQAENNPTTVLQRIKQRFNRIFRGS